MKKVLTLKTAKKFLENEDIDLLIFTWIDDTAAKTLSKHQLDQIIQQAKSLNKKHV